MTSDEWTISTSTAALCIVHGDATGTVTLLTDFGPAPDNLNLPPVARAVTVARLRAWADILEQTP